MTRSEAADAHARQLTGKVALVTGGGRGIGRAIAAALAADGAKAVLVARTQAEVEASASAIDAAGGSAIAMAGDMTIADDVERVVGESLHRFGQIDILVNAAGDQAPIGAFSSADPAQWWRGIEVNLGATFRCCRAVVPGMVQRRQGVILNLSGGGATSPRPNFSAYGVAKAAVVRLTEVLADELGEFGIRVNAIAPGGVATAMTEAIIQAAERAGPAEVAGARRVLAGQGSPVEKVAELARLLVSPTCAGLSGRLISVPWDPWPDIPRHVSEIMATDVYTLRRIVPSDRGLAL